MPALERHHLAVLRDAGAARRLAHPGDAGGLLLGARAAGGAAGGRRARSGGSSPAVRRSCTRVGPPPVLVGERDIGWVGELHPQVAAAWDLGATAAGFEIDVDAVVELTGGAEPVYRDVTELPGRAAGHRRGGRRGRARRAIVERRPRRRRRRCLAAVSVFDVYRGEQVGEGQKSLALRLSFRAPDRTLTDEEVAERRAAIEAALAELGGRLRA